MNKTVCISAAITGTLLLLTSACSMYAPVIPSSAAPPVPTLAVSAALERISATGLTTQPAALGSGVSTQPPLCDISSSCQALDAGQIPLDCVKKIPYTNVLVPVGTNFEVVDQSGDFVCVDAGVVVNGKEVLTCHGRQLYSFELKLTNAACGADNLTTGTGQCQDGYGYDAAKQCCAAIPAGSDGSITVRVNLGACPVPTP